jgi:hypothetical protein
VELRSSPSPFFGQRQFSDFRMSVKLSGRFLMSRSPLPVRAFAAALVIRLKNYKAGGRFVIDAATMPPPAGNRQLVPR